MKKLPSVPPERTRDREMDMEKEKKIAHQVFKMLNSTNGFERVRMEIRHMYA